MDHEITNLLREDLEVVPYKRRIFKQEVTGFKKLKDIAEVYILPSLRDHTKTEPTLMIRYDQAREYIRDLVFHFHKIEQEIGPIDWEVLLLEMINFTRESPNSNQPLRIKRMFVDSDDDMAGDIKKMNLSHTPVEEDRITDRIEKLDKLNKDLDRKFKEIAKGANPELSS